MDYSVHSDILRSFYEKAGLSERFAEDIAYLEQAFHGINALWRENLDQVKEANYLMIAEAPLWGKTRKYLYNPETNNSQFFYRSDLSETLKRPIADKKAFIKVCNEIGLVVVDISPFPFNKDETAVNYSKNWSKQGKLSRKLLSSEYKQLVSDTNDTYFLKRLEEVREKKSSRIKVFFRYSRVRDAFQNLLVSNLIDLDFIKHVGEIDEISQAGGGIDKFKFSQIIADRLSHSD